jgi:hypothetical protein
MVRKIYDKDKKIMTLRSTNEGAILTKGKRSIYLLFKSVNAGKNAENSISNNSFNILFNKGKKVKVLGTNTSYIKFKSTI